MQQVSRHHIRISRKQIRMATKDRRSIAKIMNRLVAFILSRREVVVAIEVGEAVDKVIEEEIAEIIITKVIMRVAETITINHKDTAKASTIRAKVSIMDMDSRIIRSKSGICLNLANQAVLDKVSRTQKEEAGKTIKERPCLARGTRDRIRKAI